MYSGTKSYLFLWKQLGSAGSTSSPSSKRKSVLESFQKQPSHESMFAWMEVRLSNSLTAAQQLCTFCMFIFFFFPSHWRLNPTRFLNGIQLLSRGKHKAISICNYTSPQSCTQEDLPPTRWLNTTDLLHPCEIWRKLAVGLHFNMSQSLPSV